MDASAAAAAVKAQFPELVPDALRLLGEGCDSIAFEANGAWVFRFPKRADVEEQLETERRLLPLLAAILPLPVPDYRLRGERSRECPLGFGAYPKLPGEPCIELPPDRIPAGWAERLGEFLSRLHAFPAREARGVGLPEFETPES